MAASDYVPTFFKNRLHSAGRPQMSTRPNSNSAVGFELQQGSTLTHMTGTHDKIG